LYRRPVTSPTATEPARRPPQLPFIIANEGCERFSFYGMRNILTMFLSTMLLAAYLPEAEAKAAAKEVFHSFVIGVYLFPLLGGWLADRYFGKYKTILWFSLVYCAGHGCLALFEDDKTGFYTGLFLIAFGSGGIKPLVATFMGDQFDQRNKHLAKGAFDAFYWIINFGSLFASILMPLFLRDLGPSIAFGIPGALMLIATIVFWAGRGRYVKVMPAPPDPNSFLRVVRTALLARVPGAGRPGLTLAGLGVALAAGSFLILPWIGFIASFCLALTVLIGLTGVGASMQLDRARGVHPPEAIEGVRAVLRILIVFALVTPFWSLFDQKASTWVLQADDMMKPGWFQSSQMQALNPALVMLLIPLNNFLVFPWLRRRGHELSALGRMTAGMAISGLAWIAVASLQLVMDGGSAVHIAWQILPYALLTLGEVLVSATGLEFAYSQAPPSMKGVIMSFWYLAVTVGNLWVLLADATVRNDAVLSRIQDTGMSVTAFLMFFFAVFAFVAAVGFRLYAKRYKMVDHYRAV
jgi:POT family proton-dependent oligopeptide transporter